MATIRGILGRQEPYPSVSQISNILTEILAQLGGKAPTVHTHEISQVNNLQSTLDTIVAGGGGLVAYTHSQPSGATVWTINHNLGYQPLVQTFTPGGVEIVGDVLNVSVNQVTVTFNSAQTGSARLL